MTCIKPSFASRFFNRKKTVSQPKPAKTSSQHSIQIDLPTKNLSSNTYPDKALRNFAPPESKRGTQLFIRIKMSTEFQPTRPKTTDCFLTDRRTPGICCFGPLVPWLMTPHFVALSCSGPFSLIDEWCHPSWGSPQPFGARKRYRKKIRVIQTTPKPPQSPRADPMRIFFK